MVGRVLLSPDWKVTNSELPCLILKVLIGSPFFTVFPPFYNSEVPQFNIVGIISAAIA